MNHFIELELASPSEEGQKIELSSMFIESMQRTDQYTYTAIRMFSGGEHYVKETPKEIKKLMDTKKITYFNQQP